MDSVLFLPSSSPAIPLSAPHNQAIMNFVCVFPVYFKHLYKHQCICEQMIVL